MTFDQAIVQAAEHAKIAATVTTEPDVAVVLDGEEFRFFDASAWQRPTNNLLPWIPPPFTPVAIVRPDGTLRQ